MSIFNKVIRCLSSKYMVLCTYFNDPADNGGEVGRAP